MDKPIPPSDDDCCGGGACDPCVWDYFYEQRRKWKQLQDATDNQSSAHSTTQGNVSIRININSDDPQYR